MQRTLFLTLKTIDDLKLGGWKSISPDNDTTVESRALDLVSQLEAAATVDTAVTVFRIDRGEQTK